MCTIFMTGGDAGPALFHKYLFWACLLFFNK